MVERGLAESRAQAQRLIMAGQVRVDEEVILKPSVMLTDDSRLSLVERPKYLSRGGEKLAAALTAFSVQVVDEICADVGASTGGFTDCLLQQGALKVYAIDVGHGILHWKLRRDGRVVVMEETNARYIERLPELIHLVTIDASFISLKTLLPVVKNWLDENGEVIALIKPQFEAGRRQVARGEGVIRDPGIHHQILQDILKFTEAEGFRVRGLIRSPLLGPKGNTEFLAWFSIDTSRVNEDIEALIRGCVPL